MALTTQKLDRLAKDFRSSAEHNVLCRLQDTLEKRKLGHRHLDDAFHVLKKIHEQNYDLAFYRYLQDTKDRARNVKERLVYSSIILMGAITDSTKYFVPISCMERYAHDEIIIITRSLPIRLKYSHLQDRYGQRTGKPLAYNSENIFNVLVFGTTLLRAYEHYFQGDKQKPRTILIPDENGFFIGKVELVSDSMDHALIPKFTAAICNSTGTSVNFTNIGTWIPQHEARLFTYVDKNLFTSTQHELYERLIKFYNDERLYEGMRADLTAYRVGDHGNLYTLYPEKAQVAISTLQKEIFTPLWFAAATTKTNTSDSKPNLQCK